MAKPQTIERFPEVPETFHEGVKAKEEAPSDLAERRKFLAAQIADIESKLTAGKEPELESLRARVYDFNKIFGTSYELTEVSAPSATSAAPRGPRLCSVCKGGGHNKKNCPQLKAVTA